MSQPTARPRKLGPIVVLAGSFGLAACAGSGLFGSNQPARTPTEVGIPKVQTQTVSNSDIPVLVNDRPITSFDIDQRARLMRIGGAKGGSKAATEELIDEMLQMIEAERRNVRVNDDRVDGAYASIASNLKLTPTRLDQALRQEGIQPDSLKRRLRAQIAWSTLVRRRTEAESTIRTSDVTAALLDRGDPSQMTLTEYFLQQIVFVVPKGSPDARYNQRRNEANAFRQRFAGCEGSLEQAKRLNAVVVLDLGRRSSDQLNPRQLEQLRETAVGKTTQPQRTEQGVEMIAVCSTREVRSTAAARAEIQNKYALEQAEGLGESYLKELREAAIIVYR